MEKFHERDKLDIKTALFLIILISFAVYNLFYIHQSFSIDRSWQLSDWLINYNDGGFKRRGLTGSIFFFLQDITGFSLTSIVFWTVAFLNIAFLFLFYINYKNHFNLGMATLMLSPLCFGFWLVDFESVDRKEIILFLLLSFLIYMLKAKRGTRLFPGVMAVLICLSTLIHEFTLFFVPYFILGYYLFSERRKSVMMLYFSAAFIPSFFIFHFGAAINEGQSVMLINKRGIALLNNGIFALPKNWEYSISLKDFTENYIKYLISFFIGLVYFFAYIHVYLRSHSKKLMWLFIGIFVYSLPLFYIAGDWGRWLNIHFTLFMVIILALPSEKKRGWKLFYVLFPTVFLWGFNVYSDGFHFYTKFNILILKIIHFLF